MSESNTHRDAFKGAVFPRGWSLVESAADTFATNSVVLGDGERRLEVVPDVASSASVESVDGYVVPVVCGPVTATWEQVLSWQSWFATSFHDAWLGNAPAWFVDRDRRWVEPALFIDRLLHEVVVGDLHSRLLAHCRVRGVPYVVRLAAGAYEAIRVPDESVVATVTCGTFSVGSTCVLDGRDSVCTMHGGPWTSSSMRAAAAWSTHRSRLVAALGCSVCGGTRYRLGDRLFEGNPIITPVEPSVPTRWLQAEAE